MAKLILKAPYYKPGSTTAGGKSRGGYVKYIATRDGVEILQDRGGMADYIGERKGSNGMFTDEGQPIIMSQIKEEIDNHKGNVWGLIFSLKREDAERVGYNCAVQWMNLLRSHRNDIAKEMNITPEHMRWNAAYHNSETHPHVHMLVWSSRPQEPNLNKVGIHNIKHTIANDIFRQDLISVYKEQTEVRDDIKGSFRAEMQETLDKIKKYPFCYTEIAEKLEALAEVLRNTNGKKVYGYLKADVKQQVNEIVKMIGEEEKISELYESWYQCHCETYRTYTDIMPIKVTLEENNEFKSLRNTVVSIAAKMDLLPEYEFVVKAYDYKIIYGEEEIKEAIRLMEIGGDRNREKAVSLLEHVGRDGNPWGYTCLGETYVHGLYTMEKNTAQGEKFLRYAAESGNTYAMFRLGRLHLGELKDMDEAEYWLKQASDKGERYSSFLLYSLYHSGVLESKKGEINQYFMKAVDQGFAPAEYSYALKLKEKAPEKAKEYLQKSLKHESQHAQYELGRTLLDEGKTKEALYYLEEAAKYDFWVRTKLGLFYYYQMGQKEKGMEHLQSAANYKYRPAENAIRVIQHGYNAQIAAGVMNLFYYAGNIIEQSAEEQFGEPNYGGVDIRTREEERAKRQGLVMDGM